MDPRRFLRPTAPITALYLGGLVVYAPNRVIRLRADSAPSADAPLGFVRVRLEGRYGIVEGPSDDSIDLTNCPARTGHHAFGYLFFDAGVAALELLGAPEPEVFAPVRAREHETGALLFADALFETEVELELRARLERGDDGAISDVKGVGKTLRAAYAFALATRVARELGAPLSPLEVRGAGLAIAERGVSAARELVGARLRARAAESAADAARGILHAHRRAARADAALDPVERAERALERAGARLLGARVLDDAQLEVRWSFLGERFISVVHAVTLHVFDAGICLAGADEEVTLESLPSVVREAVDTDVLVITRR
ncbi:MAG: hypothetical protein U0271_28770 [Polyangiaceae bacterium]